MGGWGCLGLWIAGRFENDTVEGATGLLLTTNFVDLISGYSPGTTNVVPVPGAVQSPGYRPGRADAVAKALAPAKSPWKPVGTLAPMKSDVECESPVESTTVATTWKMPVALKQWVTETPRAVLPPVVKFQWIA